ncbi:MAG: 2-isopropylmalate synthase, partial [Clostridiales bacterium]|nr:2-isopropylmalate synthase [Clostridiales bacterium]
KALADKKKDITVSDLEALANNIRRKVVGGWQLLSHVVNVGHGIPNTSYVKMQLNDEEKEEVAVGSGPLDASFKAINRITNMPDVKLESFSLKAVTDGEDAVGEAVVKINHNGELYTGTGISTDIIESSIRAYVNGINKIQTEQKG